MTKGHKETLEGVVFVHYLDCGDGLTDVYICHLIKLYVYFVCGKFIVHRFYFN